MNNTSDGCSDVQSDWPELSNASCKWSEVGGAASSVSSVCSELNCVCLSKIPSCVTITVHFPFLYRGDVFFSHGVMRSTRLLSLVYFLVVGPVNQKMALKHKTQTVLIVKWIKNHWANERNYFIRVFMTQMLFFSKSNTLYYALNHSNPSHIDSIHNLGFDKAWFVLIVMHNKQKCLLSVMKTTRNVNPEAKPNSKALH